jgi:hypothetical protein
MQIALAQEEMRRAYFGGAPGMLVSSIAWLTAALVAVHQSPQRAVIALFVGGILIHPISTLLTKFLGRSAKHSPGNPLGRLAFETTIWLIASLPLAYVVSRFRIEWFFPAMLLVIAGRYTVFSTVFGSRIFWVCGAALMAAAYVLFKLNATPEVGALTGASIEALFSATIFARSRMPVGLQAAAEPEPEM